MTQQKLLCARDPYGFRPLCYGKTKDNIYVVASESTALKAVGADFIRDVQPGEILAFDKDSVVSYTEHCGTKEKRMCSFEYIYLSLIHIFAAKYPVDFVIGSSHLVHGQDPYYAEYYEGKTEQQAYEQYFLSILENAQAFDCFQVYGQLDLSLIHI